MNENLLKDDEFFFGQIFYQIHVGNLYYLQYGESLKKLSDVLNQNANDLAKTSLLEPCVPMFITRIYNTKRLRKSDSF